MRNPDRGGSVEFKWNESNEYSWKLYLNDAYVYLIEKLRESCCPDIFSFDYLLSSQVPYLIDISM